MSQYIHLLSNSSAGTPVDYWLPSSNNIKPQYISQFSAGYFRQIKSMGTIYQLKVTLKTWKTRSTTEITPMFF